jgi:hypothetical protein
MVRLALLLTVGAFAPGSPMISCADGGPDIDSAAESLTLATLDFADDEDIITITFDSEDQISYTDSANVCIGFGGSEDDGAGKTLLIAGSTSKQPIISVMSNTETNGGAFVSLGGIYGAEGEPFTLKLDVTSSGAKDKADFWYAAGVGNTSDHFVGFGAMDADTNSCGHVSIVPNPYIPMSVILANNAWSTVFGAVSCSGQSGTFNNFYVGRFAQDSTLVGGTVFGVCQAISGTDFTGTGSSGGACSGNFSNVTIGGIGANSTLVAKQSVFGAGYVACRTGSGTCSDNLNNWTIGPIGDNVSLTTAATASASGRSACVFGATHTGQKSDWPMVPTITFSAAAANTCAQWTAEFQGSATVTAMATYTQGGNARNLISTLGGEQNSDMRFYFNDLAVSPYASAAARPSVVVSALRLQSPGWNGGPSGSASDNPWNVGSENDSIRASADLDNTQEKANDSYPNSHALAVSLGPNFQLNVGRGRSMVSNWADRARGGWKSPTENGTWETDTSAVRGGGTYVIEGDQIRRIGPGTLTIIGGIAKANADTVTTGATLRVNSGWDVNCFGYVKDLEGGISVRGNLEKESTLNFYGPVAIPDSSTVTIGPRGAINLHRAMKERCGTFENAFDQINNEAAFYADASSSPAGGSGYNNKDDSASVLPTALTYNNDKIGLYQTDNSDRAFARKGKLQLGFGHKDETYVAFGGDIRLAHGDDNKILLTGGMTLGENSKMVFSGGTHGGYLQLHRNSEWNDSDAVLKAVNNLLSLNLAPQLEIKTGVKFHLLDTRNDVPGTFDYWIVRCPAETGTNISSFISGITLDGKIDSASDPSITWGENYYKITYNSKDASTSLLDLKGTAYAPRWKEGTDGQIRLLWSDDSEKPGLYIVGRLPTPVVTSASVDAGESTQSQQPTETPAQPESTTPTALVQSYHDITDTAAHNYIVLDTNVTIDSVHVFYTTDNNFIRFDGADQISYTQQDATDAIKFLGSADGHNGEYAGKTVSITGTTTARPIINVTGNGSQTTGNAGTFVSLNEVSGAPGAPFTLRLDVTSSGDVASADFEYRSGLGGTYGHFTGFGASNAEYSSAYISIVPSETVPMSVVLANNAWSTAFGAVSCSGRSDTFNNFYVGPCAPDSTFVAGTMFGVCKALSGTDFDGQKTGGACSNNFSNMTIGGIGANSTLMAKQTIFGGGYVSYGTNSTDYACENNCSKCTIGPIGNNVSLTTLASASMTGKSACVFGTAYMGAGLSLITSPFADGAQNNFNQWTTEFQGSATVSAMAPYDDGYKPNSASFVSALGGRQNSNMRFYFNDLEISLDSPRPTVVISALHLASTPTSGSPGGVTIAVNQAQDGGGGGPSQGASLGPNFQLNVGRRRVMLPRWNERARGGQKSPTQNGTWEADASVARGGITHLVKDDHMRHIGPGTLSIIGGIGMAPQNTSTDGAILRINSGWDVNCFGQVSGLKGGISIRGSREKASTLNLYGETNIPNEAVITIDTRGAINLHRKNNEVCEAFNTAFEQIKANASFYADASSVSGLGVPDEKIGLYQQNRDGRSFERKGNFNLDFPTTTSNFTGGMTVTRNESTLTVKPNGKMTLGVGSKVRFAGGRHGGYLKINADTLSVQPAPLTIGSNVKFSLLDTNHTVPETFDYWIVRFPTGTAAAPGTMSDLIDGLTMPYDTSIDARTEQEVDDPPIKWGNNYFEVNYNTSDASVSLLDLTGTAYEPRWSEGTDGQIRLLWSNDSSEPGLYVVGRIPPGPRGPKGESGENGTSSQGPTSGDVAQLLMANSEFIGMVTGEDGSDGEPGSPGPTSEAVAQWLMANEGFLEMVAGKDGASGENADNSEIARLLAADEEFISDLADVIKDDSEFQELIRGPQGLTGEPGKDATASEVGEYLKDDSAFMTAIADDLASDSDFQSDVASDLKGDLEFQILVKGDPGDDADNSEIARLLASDEEFISELAATIADDPDFQSDVASNVDLRIAVKGELAADDEFQMAVADDLASDEEFKSELADTIADDSEFQFAVASDLKGDSEFQILVKGDPGDDADNSEIARLLASDEEFISELADTIADDPDFQSDVASNVDLRIAVKVALATDKKFQSDIASDPDLRTAVKDDLAADDEFQMAVADDLASDEEFKSELADTIADDSEFQFAVASDLKGDSEFQILVKGDPGDDADNSEIARLLASDEEFISELADTIANDSDFQSDVASDLGLRIAVKVALATDEKFQSDIASDPDLRTAVKDDLASDEEFISDLADEIKEDSEFQELIRGSEGEPGEVRVVHTYAVLPPMDRVVLSRNIMRAKRAFMAKMLQAIDQRTCDIKGNNDPFILAFGGYERYDADESNLGSSSHFHGAFLGEDWIRHAFDNFYLRYGIGIGRVHSKSNFFGSLVEDFHGATCKETAGSGFISCEFYNEKRQKMNLCATAAINLGSNKILRHDGKPEKFDDVSFHGKIAFMREVSRVKGMRISPKADLRYAFFHAYAYRIPTSAADEGDFQAYLDAMFDDDIVNDLSQLQLNALFAAYSQTRVVPAIDNHIIDMTLGLSFEKEIEDDEYDVRPLKLQCDLGWQRRVMRKITSIAADYGKVRNTFTLDMGNGASDFFVCSGSFRKRLNPHWELRGQWSGACGIKYRGHSANLSLGYEF